MTDDLQQARVEAAAEAFRNSEASAKATTSLEVSISAALAAGDAIQSKAKSSQNFVLPSVEELVEVIREYDLKYDENTTPADYRRALAKAIHALFGEVAGDE